MANSSPAWVDTVQVAVVVNNEPVTPLPTTEAAAGAIGRYTGSDITYQELVSWAVATGKVGELKEILILSDNYTKTAIQITVAGTVFKTNWIMLSAMPLIFEDLHLAEGDEVLVEVESTDGTSIMVDGVIVGKEIG